MLARKLDPIDDRIGSGSRVRDRVTQRSHSEHAATCREFDLRRRLFKYPCSYMIYTPAFDALPPAAKSAVYSRLWEVLSGKDMSPRYKGLAPADRKAIISILLETKRDLPEYFKPVA